MITDMLEMQLLSQLQQKRAAEARVQAQQEWGLKHLAAGVNRMLTVASNPTTAASSNGASTILPLDISAPGAIQNRSPISNTHNHYYNATPPTAAGPVIIQEPSPAPVQPTPAPAKSPLWPWLLAIPLVIALGGLTAYLLWPKPTGTSTKPTPPPNWTADPTINLLDAP